MEKESWMQNVKDENLQHTPIVPIPDSEFNAIAAHFDLWTKITECAGVQEIGDLEAKHRASWELTDNYAKQYKTIMCSDLHCKNEPTRVLAKETWQKYVDSIIQEEKQFTKLCQGLHSELVSSEDEECIKFQPCGFDTHPLKLMLDEVVAKNKKVVKAIQKPEVRQVQDRRQAPSNGSECYKISNYNYANTSEWQGQPTGHNEVSAGKSAHTFKMPEFNMGGEMSRAINLKRKQPSNEEGNDDDIYFQAKRFNEGNGYGKPEVAFTTARDKYKEEVKKKKADNSAYDQDQIDSRLQKYRHPAKNDASSRKALIDQDTNR